MSYTELDLNGTRAGAVTEIRKTKRRVLKLSPELADGDSWTVFEMCEAKEALIQSVSDWFDQQSDDALPGEGFEVTVVEMTGEEIEALPEI